MAVQGDTVFYKTKVPATLGDPRGDGKTPDATPNIANIPAVISRVLNVGTQKMALLVFSDPPFSVIGSLPFNPGAPTWGTWEPRP